VRRNFAGLFAVLATGALLAAGPVLAQSTTTTPTTTATTTVDTSTLGNYQSTSPTVTTSTPTTPVENGSSPTSAVEATPVASAPAQLAFTGANAIWIILLGAGLAGVAATLLLVDRRSRKNR
jgi:hypothetical protein